MAFFVFDLDGTLALVDHRRHFMQKQPKDHRAFYAACDQDGPNVPVIAALKAHIAAGHRVEIWSGRSHEVYDKTIAWLKRHEIAPELLTRMRATGDRTKDHILKAKWLAECGEKPLAVYDDRTSVVSLAWRANGVCCFQVAADWESPEETVIRPDSGTQRLYLMVGPSGGGKSHLVASGFQPDVVISSDRIREQLCSGGLRDQSRNDDVFLAVRRIARARLLSGLSVVIDATHLRRKNRIEHAKLAPDGVPVEYWVIDRPLVDKVRDGGWRNNVFISVGNGADERKITLIEKHDMHFQSELPHILAGDGLPNVVVCDMRKQPATAA